MRDPDFATVVAQRLDPVLAPRGFPYAGHHNGVAAAGEPAVTNPDDVLFHCDGPQEVSAAIGRDAGWEPLREAYGHQEIVCLDLWVSQEEGVRSWSFEGLEAAVLEAAGASAHHQLAELQGGELDAWVDRLAAVLEHYFDTVDREGGAD